MEASLSTPFELCGHHVPGYWRYLLPKEAQQFRLPRERRATCHNCPMACFQGHDSVYRCCAYHPQVPNFLLGLAGETQKVRGVLGNLERQGFLLPEGFMRSPGQWVDYLADLKDNRFDASTRVKCPLLEVPSGLCQIYAFRNAVCSTFFCYNDHGEAGDEFWRVFEEMISYAELGLCQWALARCGFDVPAYYRRLDSLAPRIADVTDPKTHGWKEEVLDFLWAEHADRKLELYAECAAQIEENRERLWEIARAQTVLDAPKFERAGVKMVPKELEDEIDPADLEEDEGESMTLDDHWDEVLDAYHEMWDVPPLLKLSPRAVLAPNPKDDKESQAFGHLPYVAVYLKRKGGKAAEWRQFVSESEYNALSLFSSPRATDESTTRQMNAPDLADPHAFLAEWHGKKFLVPEKPRPPAGQ
jgi:Fe-S-cluster containining protein